MNDRLKLVIFWCVLPLFSRLLFIIFLLADYITFGRISCQYIRQCFMMNDANSYDLICWTNHLITSKCSDQLEFQLNAQLHFMTHTHRMNYIRLDNNNANSDQKTHCYEIDAVNDGSSEGTAQEKRQHCHFKMAPRLLDKWQQNRQKCSYQARCYIASLKIEICSRLQPTSGAFQIFITNNKYAN